MYLLWYCLICVGLAFIMAALFQQKFEMAIITAHCAIIGALFFFYVFNILDAGFYLICLLFGIGIIYGIYKIVRLNRIESTLKLVCRPSAAAFFLLLFLIYLTVRMNTVNLIDELHLWGALPKILFSQNGQLQLGNTMLLGFQDYIPGMSLWLYFLERLNGQFSEAVLYFGYASLGGAMLLPMCGRISDYKKWYVLPVISIIMYLLPLTFYNSLYNDHAIYYKSLHVDAILGIAVCYVTWLLQKKPWKSLISMIQFSLGLTVLALIKSTGVVFVFLLVASMFIYIYFVEKEHFKRYLYWVVLPFITAITWKVCLIAYGVQETIEYSVSKIFNIEGIKTFCMTLLSHSIMQPRNINFAKVCTFASLIAGIFFLYLVWWFAVRHRLSEKKIMKWTFMTMILQIVVFMAGLYGLYVGAFQSQILSIPRYSCTILTAFFTFWVYNFIYEFEAIRRGSVKWTTGLIVLLFSMGILYPFYPPSEIKYPKIALRDADKIENILILSEDILNERKGSKVALVVDGAYNSISPDFYLYLWRRLYFNLLDEDILVGGLYFDTDINKIEAQKSYLEIKLLNESKWDGYEYVFWVHYIDDTEKSVEIYKVISENYNNVSLQQVAEQHIK